MARAVSAVTHHSKMTNLWLQWFAFFLQFTKALKKCTFNVPSNTLALENKIFYSIRTPSKNVSTNSGSSEELHVEANL